MTDPRHVRAAAGVVRPVLERFARGYFDLAVTGRDHIPRAGPVVVAANHFSHIDPPLVTVVARRQVRYIAVDELWGNSRVLDMLTGYFGAIPTDRDGYPVTALRTAIRHLEAGGAMGIFPEGARAVHWGERSPKRGAAWLAWITGSPLVPVAIHGSDGTMAPGDLRLRRTAVRVWVGEPMWWFDYADRIDPLAAMTIDWADWVGDRLAPWLPRPQGDAEETTADRP